MENELSTKDFGIVEDVKPFASYIKTILGQVYVTVLSPYSGKPEGVILSGNPRNQKEIDGCIVDVWNQKEDMYFQKVNATHLTMGYLVKYTRPLTKAPPTEEEIVNNMSDDEMKAILKEKFFVLQNKVNKMTSVAPVYRLLEIAKEMEKSNKIIAYLEGKLAELQLKGYPQPLEEEPEDKK